MTREAFLKRVKAAAEAGRQHRVHLRKDLPARVGYVGGGDDLIARMASEVQLAGGDPRVVDSLAEARTVVDGLLETYRVRSAVCWEHEVLDRLGLDMLFQGRNIERLSFRGLSVLPQEEQRVKTLAAEVGISSTSWGIAETGTLAVCSKPGQERQASLVPPVHIAIITQSQILPDLFDLFDRLVAAGVERMPSNLTLITGPSKTGDLELRLTTGVHGPGKWHVIISRSDD